MGETTSRAETISSRLSQARISLRLAELTAQRSNETPDSEPWYLFYFRLLVLFAVCGTCLAFFKPVVTQLRRHATISPTLITFERDRWKIVPADTIMIGPKDPCEGALVSRSCPAHPRHPIPDNFLKSGDKGSSYWLIYDLTTEEARRARETRSNILLFEPLIGVQKVFVDGALMRNGSSRPERGAASISLPLNWLNHPLRIALRIDEDFEVPVRQFSVGLTDERRVDGLAKVRGLVNETAYLTLAMAYFLVAAFFLMFWLGMRHKRELFGFALFSVVLGFLAVRESAWVDFGMPTYRIQQLELFLRSAEALAILWAGFATARIRRVLKISFSSMILLFYVYLNFSSETTMEFHRGCVIVGDWLLPFSCFLATLMCALQARWVSQHIRTTGAVGLKDRRSALVWYTGIFGYLFALSATTTWIPASNSSLMSLAQCSPVVLVLFIAFRVFGDFKKSPTQNDFVPLSRFHRMSPMPERVKGVLLDLDLKKSEVLYRAASYSTDQNMFVAPFVDAWISIVRSIGGDVISFQGDMILALFEADGTSDETISNIMQKISDALWRIDTLMPEIAQNLEQRASVSIRALIGRPAFRASISFGTIRPTLIGQGSQKIAAWMNADENQVLMRMSRLSEAERVALAELADTEARLWSTAVIDEETIAAAPIDRFISSFSGRNARTERGVKTFLKGKGSTPPVLSLVAFANTARGTKGQSRLTA